MISAIEARKMAERGWRERESEREKERETERKGDGVIYMCDE